jgi:hypothetical protein
MLIEYLGNNLAGWREHWRPVMYVVGIGGDYVNQVFLKQPHSSVFCPASPMSGERVGRDLHQASQVGPRDNLLRMALQ